MSSTILTVIVLVVMWLVVLVPMFVRRADEVYDTAAGELSDDLSHGTAGDLADGDPLRDDDRDDRDDGTDEESGAPAPAAVAPGGAGTWDGAPGDPLVSAGIRERMMVRRRRTLGTLVVLTLFTLIAVVLSEGRPGVWVIQVGCDLLLLGYLAGLRHEVRRERVRRALLIARATAARARASARRAAIRQERVEAAARRREAERIARTRRRAALGLRDDAAGQAEDDPITRRRVV